MQIEVITKEDLKSLQDEITQIKFMFQDKLTEHRKWIKSTDVCKMLNISNGTLQTLRINRTLPFTKVGGTIFYEYDEIIAVLNKNKSAIEK
ncbi:MAG: helix-turn-helix domain-containing protein [Bacteroidetes bacterium]|nr:helix-turn-helix domain-containing protein [Bacteroidota bacterium]